jgi:hypothetical protein
MHHIPKMLVFLMLLVMIESINKSDYFFYSLLNISFFFRYRQSWISLGDMSKEKAMEEYIKILLDRCSIFRTYLENQNTENEEKDRLR